MLVEPLSRPRFAFTKVFFAVHHDAKKNTLFPKSWGYIQAKCFFSTPKDCITNHHWKVNIPSVLFVCFPEVIIYFLYFISNLLLMMYLQNVWEVGSWTWVEVNVFTGDQACNLISITFCSGLSGAILHQKLLYIFLIIMEGLSLDSPWEKKGLPHFCFQYFSWCFMSLSFFLPV